MNNDSLFFILDNIYAFLYLPFVILYEIFLIFFCGLFPSKKPIIHTLSIILLILQAFALMIPLRLTDVEKFDLLYIVYFNLFLGGLFLFEYSRSDAHNQERSGNSCNQVLPGLNVWFSRILLIGMPVFLITYINAETFFSFFRNSETFHNIFLLSKLFFDFGFGVQTVTLLTILVELFFAFQYRNISRAYSFIFLVYTVFITAYYYSVFQKEFLAYFIFFSLPLLISCILHQVFTISQRSVVQST
ncbi:hypothetical protein LLG10_08280 [bacterium]|nr:hypothetical protein [bacterium]